MGGISSSVGLFSGIDSKALIDQLLAVEARPKVLIQQRITQLQQQQAAFLDINSSLLALKTAAGNFASTKVFDAARAVSTDDKVLSASAAANASPGSFTFTVNRLVTTQQLLSRGFADKNAALNASSFTFETGGGNISTETALSELNGSAGVQRGRIVLTDTTSPTGATTTIDLSTAVTVNDVLEAVNNNGKVNVTAEVDGDRIRLKSGSGVTSFTVASASGGRTAEDLGLAGASASGAIAGTRVRSISGNTALRALNDGVGVNIRDGAPDFKVTTRSGVNVNIQLGEIKVVNPDGSSTVTQARAVTVNDAISIFNAQAQTQLGSANQLTLALNAEGNGFVVTDNTAGTGNMTITSESARTTAEDLGIATSPLGVAGTTLNGKRVVSGINSRLARNVAGGTGFTSGAITVTDRAGNSKSITVSDAALSGSVSDVISEINSQLASTTGGVVQAKVGLNRAGNGVSLSDTSGGSGNLVISGGLADALGLTTTGAAAASVNGKNLQTRWIGRSTALADLNLGKGIGTGTIRVTDTTGQTITFDVNDNIKTVDDFIQNINVKFSGAITARINDNGDGIAIVDSKGGSSSLRVEDVSGSVGKNLNLLGESTATAGVATRDGSFEKRVTFAATDSLESVVNKINSASVGFSAALIRDGSGGTPFRVSLTARDSGTRGRTLIDTGALDLGLSALSRGDDAVAFFGNADPARAVLLTSSTNTLDQVIQGVTVDLKSTSTSPVTVTVSRDQDAIEKSIKDFVSAFNKVLDTIDKYDGYNAETNRRGALLGDSTASQLKSRLLSAVQGEPTGVSGQFTRLFQVGVKIGAGSKLEFDSTRFRSAYTADPQNVEDLFAASVLAPKTPIEVAPGATIPNTTDTYTRLGIAEAIRVLSDKMTNSVDGTVTTRNRTIDTQITAQRTRTTNLDRALEAKRARLERQFVEMEKAIGSLRNQSNALSSINLGG